jgi:hypothetical protein
VNDVPAGRGPDRGVRGSDVGGVGSVPAPTGFGRRTAPVGGGAVDLPRGGERPAPAREVTRPDVGRNPAPPPGEPTGRREAPGIEIVPRPSEDQPDRRRNDEVTGGRETPKSPNGQTPGFTPGQAKPADAPRPGDGWYGRRQPDDARPNRPDQARPQGRETPPARAPEGRPANPPPRERPQAPPPQAREAPRQAPSQPRANPRQEPQRGSNPQLERRRP